MTRKIPFILAMIILAGHFLRWGSILFAIICLIFPVMLLIKQEWVISFLRAITWFATAFWLLVSTNLVLDRLAQEGDWIRLAIIMLAVTVFTWWAGHVLGTLRAEYSAGGEADDTSDSTDDV
jgi:hypothetical protein